MHTTIKQTKGGINHLEKETKIKHGDFVRVHKILDEYYEYRKRNEDFSADLMSISGRRLG